MYLRATTAMLYSSVLVATIPRLCLLLLHTLFTPTHISLLYHPCSPPCHPSFPSISCAAQRRAAGMLRYSHAPSNLLNVPCRMPNTCCHALCHCSLLPCPSSAPFLPAYSLLFLAAIYMPACLCCTSLCCIPAIFAFYYLYTFSPVTPPPEPAAYHPFRAYCCRLLPCCNCACLFLSTLFPATSFSSYSTCCHLLLLAGKTGQDLEGGGKEDRRKWLF